MSNTATNLNDNNAVANAALQFKYDDDTLEVVIIDNGENDCDGYVELSAAAKLLTPIATIRGFNKAVMWTNVLPSHKLIRNNKNYIHVFALCKYLAMYNLNNSRHPPEYYVLKRLVNDLLMGVQSQMVDPINDIKTQLCTLQECFTNQNYNVINNKNDNGNIIDTNNSGSGVVGGINDIYLPTTQTLSASNNNNLTWIDSMRDIVRNENNTLYSNLASLIESVKHLQIDFTNKLSFSNDTMLDNFKSLKDIVVRKK
nr:capsid protein p24 [Ectropis obliqua nucleopolyhedrovirus]